MEYLKYETVLEIEKFVFNVFLNVKDKGNNPYKNHLQSVKFKAQDLATPFSVINNEINYDHLDIISVCHDLKEDFPNAWDKLLELHPFMSRFESSIDLLTRNSEETYSEFIDRICDSDDKYAIIVKLADNLDNNAPHRLAQLGQDGRDICRRYDTALVKLRRAYFLQIDKRIVND